MKQSIEKIPTWAFGYIFNGDITGLTDEEVRMIDETLKRIGAELVCTKTVIQTVSILNKPDYLKYYFRINI